MTMNTLPDNTGLVLEGGGMRGVFTDGVLDFFLDHLTKAFDELAPSYCGAGAAQGPITRKVCAATSTWLDTLLDRYGSKYEEKAEALREHLHACEEKAEKSRKIAPLTMA